MTRVIAGEWRGRRLVTPAGTATRPTSDRAREGLFNALQSRVALDGARVLDLYAGSGALGIEALSRGAAEATLVEHDAAAARAIEGNLAALGVPAARARVVRADVSRFLAGPVSPFDLVLLDPPYDADADPVLDALVPWVAGGGVVVLERSSRAGEPAWPDGLTGERSRRYGAATLWYGFRS